MIDSFQNMKFLCFGGTFDHLHVMHKMMLSTAGLLSSCKMHIGISSDGLLVKKKFRESMQDFEMRRSKVARFISNFCREGTDANVAELTDPFGPWKSNFDSILVSEETQKGGKIINDMRTKEGLEELNIVVLKVTILDF